MTDVLWEELDYMIIDMPPGTGDVALTVMLTGDINTVGGKVAKELGLDEVHAELLPDQEVEKIELLDKEKSAKGKLVFVGDGINDAPVLARADIGIAMGESIVMSGKKGMKHFGGTIINEI